MPFPSVEFARRAADPTAKAVQEKRRHPRVAITLLGRFMRQSKHEYPCKLVDISVGGAAMMSPVQLRMDERIVAYFDQAGGSGGPAPRLFEGGFALRLNATAHKREKLAAQLTWLVNRHEMKEQDARRHERIAIASKSMPLKLDDGLTVDCRVLDISLSGASVETNARPMVGAEVVLGRLRSRVVRHHENGLGLQFLDVQQIEALKGDFV